MTEKEIALLKEMGAGRYGWTFTSWMRDLCAKAAVELEQHQERHEE